MLDGFASRKYLADNGALIAWNGRGGSPREKNSARSVRAAAQIGEGECALSKPEVPLNEPRHAAEVLRQIADSLGGRVGGHYDQGHTESHLVTPIRVRSDRRGFMVVPAAPIVPGDNDRGVVPIRYLFAVNGVCACALSDRVDDGRHP